MGLLDVLDHHYGNGAQESEEEYLLVSWGEIHSADKTRPVVLADYPFKLDISSPPQVLPQKLHLTFREPQQVRRRRSFTEVGPYPDETAEEFAAFLALVTRRRVFVVTQVRERGTPTAQPAAPYDKCPHSQRRQSPKEIEPTKIYQLLVNLHGLDKTVAQRHVLAMRLYHSAVEMMYTEPEFAYLFLVMSLEAIASAVYSNDDVMPSDQDEDGRTELDKYLDSIYPGWRECCNISNPEQRKKVIEMLAWFRNLGS